MVEKEIDLDQISDPKHATVKVGELAVQARRLLSSNPLPAVEDL